MEEEEGFVEGFEEFEEEEDDCIGECYDDMSLSGCSGDANGNEAYSQEGDGCINLDAELDKFCKELHDQDNAKNLVSKDLLCVSEIKAMAQKVLNSGLDRNGKAKLEQLKTLQELHV